MGGVAALAVLDKDKKGRENEYLIIFAQKKKQQQQQKQCRSFVDTEGEKKDREQQAEPKLKTRRDDTKACKKLVLPPLLCV